MAAEELTQRDAPVNGGTQQLPYLRRDITLASAALLGLGLTPPQGMVNLLVQRFTLFLVHVLGFIPAMLIEALVWSGLARATTLLLVCALLTGLAIGWALAIVGLILLLLPQYVEDLLGAHAIEALIIDTHAGAVRVARELAHSLFGVSLHNHPVNHIVTSDVGQVVVNLGQLAPCSQVPKPLVHSLMQAHEG